MGLTPSSSEGGAGTPTGWTEANDPADVNSVGGQLYVSPEFRVYRPSDNERMMRVLDNSTTIKIDQNATGVFTVTTLDGYDLIIARKDAKLTLGQANTSGVLPTGAFFTKVHAAPADADLSTGDLALWFDQTNGAAKLMVKAKDALGAVVTASVALA